MRKNAIHVEKGGLHCKGHPRIRTLVAFRGVGLRADSIRKVSSSLLVCLCQESLRRAWRLLDENRKGHIDMEDWESRRKGFSGLVSDSWRI